MNPVKLVVKLMEEEPLVEMAEHDLNQRATMAQLALPTDPDYARQWHLHTHLTHAQFDVRSSSRCEEAWRLLGGFGSPDVVVGVTDDGCKLDHPDFDSPGKFANWGYMRGRRLVTRDDIDSDPAQMYKPGANHGTSCAGVIAGEVDGVLTAGAVPAGRLLPVQWESSGPSLFISDSKLLTVLDFVADKVDVLSNSWGSVPLSLWASLVVRRIRELAETGGRRGQGIVFLWAAGNENCPIQHDADQDVPYTNGWERQPSGSWIWVGVRTARHFANNLVGVPGVMHVAALASSARRSHYSNYGTGILLCAPTSNVHRYHRLTVPGLGITTTTGEIGGVTGSFGGTSSATPLVAGIAALLISANPALTAAEVLSILKQTAAKDLSMEGYPRTPPASFDPNPTWDVSPVAPFEQGDFEDTGDPDGTWSPWFGHGRVDAADAVAAALARRGEEGEVRFDGDSAPGSPIPDNDPDGMQDTIHCPSEANLTAIEVEVDISHTFRGDLRLTLHSPSGRSAVLQNRNGGAANDLRRTFDTASAPELGQLLGQPMAGDWTLHIQDLAAVDVGQLNRWALALEGRVGQRLHLEEAPGVTIPDDDPAGIERRLAAGQAGQVQDVAVAVDITHTFVGDLALTLFSPAGTGVTLQRRRGGSSDNLIKTFTTASTPTLTGLRGEPVQGEWRLHVQDLAGADVGKLNRWALEIERQA
jgi:subtilisin-like proprotein convertase family protein/subtilisin family serine protease